MINQVNFEGYLVRAWEHRGSRYIRLASHRGDINPEGTSVVHSDYVTAELESGVNANTSRLNPGTHMLVTGKITSHDIYEPLGRVLEKASIQAELPSTLAEIIIPRPTVRVTVSEIRIFDDAKTTRNQDFRRAQQERRNTGTQQRGDGRGQQRGERRGGQQRQGGRGDGKPIATSKPVVPVVPAEVAEQIAPGVDLASLVQTEG